MLLLAACNDYEINKEPEDPPADSPSPVTETDPCTPGFLGDYYNLPADHPDVEGMTVGLVPGDDPRLHDWYDETWFAFQQVDTDLAIGSPWWPVDEGEPGDPMYYSVHWHAWIEVPEDAVHVFELGSDDDSWALVDNTIVADLGGIHGVEADSFFVALTAGSHSLDLYMAERHSANGGFWFRWVTPGIETLACPDA